MAFGGWTRVFGTVPSADGKKVQSVEVRLVGEDFTGTLWVTDTLLEEGVWPTGVVTANKEMLKRERDGGGNVVPNRHFNVVVRGAKTVNVPNRASISEETDLSLRVTGGMDFTFWPTIAVPAWGLKFSHQYRTRTFSLGDPLAPGDEFEFKARSRTVAVNGVKTTNYSGFYHTCPGGMGRFNVETTAGLLLCEPDQWLKGIGGERM